MKRAWAAPAAATGLAGAVGLVALLGLVALVGGCADPKLDRMLEVRDQVCRCKDAACVEAAMAKMPAKSPRDERRAQQTAREILSCVAQVGATAPEAEAAPQTEAEAAPQAPAPSTAAPTAAPPGGPTAAPPGERTAAPPGGPAPAK